MNNIKNTNFIKFKLRKNLASVISETYKKKIAIFENGQSEDFLLFIKQFISTLEDREKIYLIRSITYLRLLYAEWIYPNLSPLQK